MPHNGISKTGGRFSANVDPSPLCYQEPPKLYADSERREGIFRDLLRISNHTTNAPKPMWL
jgi:hypothetical protein